MTHLETPAVGLAGAWGAPAQASSLALRDPQVGAGMGLALAALRRAAFRASAGPQGTQATGCSVSVC